MPTPSSVLSLHQVALSERRRSSSGPLTFHLGHGETALIEVTDQGDTDLLIDLCLGLVEPVRGEVHYLGEAWHLFAYRERLARRSRIGTLVGAQVWPGYLPIAEVMLTPAFYHSGGDVDDAVDAATVLARRFGLPGLPMGTREDVPPGLQVRAACVRAFFGNPDLVIVADASLELMGELGVAMAQAIGEVQDRGGAVLWLVESVAAPAARFVAASHVVRLGDRGLVPARRPA